MLDTPNLKLPDYYINRELSALEFNRRVLHQAIDDKTPLLERLKGSLDERLLTDQRPPADA